MSILKNICDKLLEAFKSEEVKKEVLDDNWYIVNKQKQIDSAGFCFYASEVIYRLTGGKDNWYIKKISKEDWELGPHYFLQNKHTNEILDITYDQYGKDIKIPYELGKGRGLQQVSIKAKKLANYIGEII